MGLLCCYPGCINGVCGSIFDDTPQSVCSIHRLSLVNIKVLNYIKGQPIKISVHIPKHLHSYIIGYNYIDRYSLPNSTYLRIFDNLIHMYEFSPGSGYLYTLSVMSVVRNQYYFSDTTEYFRQIRSQNILKLSVSIILKYLSKCGASYLSSIPKDIIGIIDNILFNG